MKTKQEKIEALEKRIRVAEANYNMAREIARKNYSRGIFVLKDKFKINACSNKIFNLKMYLQELLDKPE